MDRGSKSTHEGVSALRGAKVKRNAAKFAEDTFMRPIMIAGFCLLLVAGPVFSQSDRGTITGTISDPAGALIAGAMIEAKNSQTGAVYQVASTSTGNYTLAQLPAAIYHLSISMPGFKQYTRTGITVMVAQTLRIDIALEVGNITETVTVNADAPLLRTESGELSHNVSSARLNELPVLGFSQNVRNPYAATQLIPGTLVVDVDGGAAKMRVNGAPSDTQALRIEGQDATSGLVPNRTSMSQPSVDAIEEVAIQTSNYAAEYGQAGGGFFNVTMKSGSNSFHGSAYEYWVNEALNASMPFQNIKSRERRNNYGFTFGGPVWIPKVYDGHDKTFFFFNFEQYRRSVIYNNSPVTVPTLLYRDGNFSQALTGRILGKDPLGRDILENAIYDPETERIVSGLRVRDPFPNNIIPKDRFDPVAVSIQNLIPAPTSDGLTSNFLYPWEYKRTYTIPAIKIDHNLNTRSKLSFYWSNTDEKEPQGRGADGIPSPVTANTGTFITSYTSRLNFDLTINPTMILHMGAGIQGNSVNNDTEYETFDQLKELGLPGSNAPGFPLISGLNAVRGGVKSSVGMYQTMGPYAQHTRTMLKPTSNASLTWVRDNHTYKFGAEMRVEGYPAAVSSTAYGNYTFSATDMGLPSTLGQNLQGGSVGFPYASFLVGRVNSGNIGVISNMRWGKSAWALFVQDTWKVTRKLTLDYGLRWDYQTYLKEQYGRASTFAPSLPNPSAGNLPGAVIFEGSWPGHCNCDFAEVYPYAFGPRLGLAYQITSKTAFRAGLGISYAQTGKEDTMSSVGGVASNNPFSSPSYGDPAILLRNGPPIPAPWPNLDPGQYPRPGTTTSPPTSFDHNAGRPPRMIQWSVSIQREIFRNLAIEIAYVGNRGAWWQGNSLIDVNALTAERISSFGLDINNATDRELLRSRLDSSTAAKRGFNEPPYAGFPMASTVAQSLRPFPQFGKISYRWAPLGRTWYDSLQIKATKRFSHGLDFSSTFTWQKELQMGTETAVNDVFDRPTNKYLSGNSRPFVFVAALNYRVPKLGGNKVLSWVLRDWAIGTMLQYASGMPILAPVAQNQLSTYLFRSTYANRVPGEPLWTVDINCHNCFDPEKDFVLNPKAWVDPPQGQFGTGAAYYGDYRQMRRPSEAMSLGRMFQIKEGVSFSIRADFQNIFNRTFLSNPTSTNAKLTQSVDSKGKPVSGFGYIDTSRGATEQSTGTGMGPRNGIIVVRFNF